jgi:hypothetical protein
MLDCYYYSYYCCCCRKRKIDCRGWVEVGLLLSFPLLYSLLGLSTEPTTHTKTLSATTACPLHPSKLSRNSRHCAAVHELDTSTASSLCIYSLGGGGGGRCPFYRGRGEQPFDAFWKERVSMLIRANPRALSPVDKDRGRHVHAPRAVVLGRELDCSRARVCGFIFLKEKKQSTFPCPPLRRSSIHLSAIHTTHPLAWWRSRCSRPGRWRGARRGPRRPRPPPPPA